VSAAAFVLGAVAYDPKVVTIWEGFKEHFVANGLPFDYVLFSNYESQVEAHLAGQVDVAWNSPLAHIETERVAKARRLGVDAVAMRDSDQDLTSIVLVKESSGIAALADLKGKRIGVGAADSPQATLLPLLQPGGSRGWSRARRGGRAARSPGRQARAITSAGSATQRRRCSRGRWTPRRSSMAISCCSPGKGPCPRIRCASWRARPPTTIAVSRCWLLWRARAWHASRSCSFPCRTTTLAVRPLLDLEGLKQWRDGAYDGLRGARRAVDRFGTLVPWLERMGAT